MVKLDKIYQAAFVLKEAARRTDLIYSEKLSGDMSGGAEIYLKTENLQVTGSFKLRGAYYKISQLTDESRDYCLQCREPRSGCGSGGNKDGHKEYRLHA